MLDTSEIVLADGAAPFHRIRHDAVVDKIKLDHMRSLGKASSTIVLSPFFQSNAVLSGAWSHT